MDIVTQKVLKRGGKRGGECDQKWKKTQKIEPEKAQVLWNFFVQYHILPRMCNMFGNGGDLSNSFVPNKLINYLPWQWGTW